MNDNNRNLGGVHWSFWVIGAVTLIYNVAGVINFFAQMNADTVAAMPEPYRAIIEDRPAWATGAFAVAVFGGENRNLMKRRHTERHTDSEDANGSEMEAAPSACDHLVGTGRIELPTPTVSR